MKNMKDTNVKLSDIINSLGTAEAPGPLTKLLNSKLPAALSYRLSVLTDEVASPSQRYGEQRLSLLKEHGTTEDGQSFNLEGEGFLKFREAMDALEREEVTVRVPQVKVSDLGEREILTPAEFRILRWLFAEEAETTGSA
jgi:hypothetical protein